MPSTDHASTEQGPHTAHQFQEPSHPSTATPVDEESSLAVLLSQNTAPVEHMDIEHNDVSTLEEHHRADIALPPQPINDPIVNELGLGETTAISLRSATLASNN